MTEKVPSRRGIPNVGETAKDARARGLLVPDFLTDDVHVVHIDDFYPLRYAWAIYWSNGVSSGVRSDETDAMIQKEGERQKLICDRSKRPKSETWDDEALPEDEAIDAAFPLTSRRFDLHDEARRLVGAKRSKGALIDLVNWLLHRIEQARAPWANVVAAAVRLADAGQASEDLLRAVREMQRKAYGDGLVIFGPKAKPQPANTAECVLCDGSGWMDTTPPEVWPPPSDDGGWNDATAANLAREVERENQPPHAFSVLGHTFYVREDQAPAVRRALHAVREEARNAAMGNGTGTGVREVPTGLAGVAVDALRRDNPCLVKDDEACPKDEPQ
jgi:hypothetical protein